jgi:Phage integrase family
VLARVCAVAGLTSPGGAAITFTAHDFRRVFATDALAAGLPPHIIQKLMGHASITTTQDYAAIFPDDVIRAHRAFNENRRQLRPADEYRDVTQAEWGEFEDHFAKRKIAIGDCMRAYGTSCVHEYACLTEMIMKTVAGSIRRECSLNVTAKNFGL